MKVSLLILCVSACVVSPQVLAKEKEVFIAVGDVPTPLEDLAAALKKNPRSAVFRASWGANGTLIWDDNVILYNRRNHTLKYYHWMDTLVDEGSDGGRNDGSLPVREVSSKSVLYRGVTDAMIHKLFAKYGNTNDSPEDVLLHLVKWGSRKRLLSSKSHKYTIK